MYITLLQLVRSYSYAYLDDLIRLIDSNGHQLYYGTIRMVPDELLNYRVARFNGQCDNIKPYHYTDNAVGNVATYLYKVKLVVTLC